MMVSFKRSRTHTAMMNYCIVCLLIIVSLDSGWTTEGFKLQRLELVFLLKRNVHWYRMIIVVLISAVVHLTFFKTSTSFIITRNISSC